LGQRDAEHSELSDPQSSQHVSLRFSPLQLFHTLPAVPNTTRKQMMKRMYVVVLFVVITEFLAGCYTLQEATLVEDLLTEGFIRNTYGEMSYKNLYFPPESDFQTNIRLYKEEVISNDDLSETEKEERLAAIRDYLYEEDRFLTFFFRLKAPAMVKQDQFDFILKDNSGGSLIEKILMYDNKVTATYTSQYGSSSSVSYNYVWIMKLRSPFDKDHIEPGAYPATVVFPNGDKLVYELDL
jgi:hypothetical protein